jgi:biopolymer transport protein ExbD
MAELNLHELFHKKVGVHHIKKATLKIDMTPMVDLGFLLVAFFVFTTQIAKPAITNLYMPHDGDSTKIPDSKSLTVLLGSNDKVYYYNGNMEKAVKDKQIFHTSYSEMLGIGSVIRKKQIDLEKREIDKKELIILIKPGKESSYKNVLNAIDEMLINGVIKYALEDISNEEETFLNRYK